MLRVESRSTIPSGGTKIVRFFLRLLFMMQFSSRAAAIASSTWWHMDESSGGDCFDSTDGGRGTADYATLYVDFDHDSNLLSRRQLAADQAAEDVWLVMFLRKKYSGDSAVLATIRNIVKNAADAGTMKAMAEARRRLIDLAR